MFLSQQQDGVLLGLQASKNFYLLLQGYLVASDQIEISFPKTIVMEDSSFTATVNFRNRAGAASLTPTTIHYRVDCLSSGEVITDWTQVGTPSTSNTIAITKEMNDIKTCGDRERKQLVVQIDRGLDTQVTNAKNWQVQNLQGIL